MSNLLRAQYDKALILLREKGKWLFVSNGRSTRYVEPDWMKEVKEAAPIVPAPGDYDYPEKWIAGNWNWFIRHYEPLGSEYNRPPFGVHPVGQDCFLRDLSKYCWKAPEGRQVRGKFASYDMTIFRMKYSKADVGIAVIYHWYDGETHRSLKEPYYTFHRWGGKKEWADFKRGFAAQFAGDNS